MILKFKLLDKYLNYLLLFLLPSQLALHFWPNIAFVFGIRVDYLSPTIYFRDALFFLLFFIWFINNRQKVFYDLKSIGKYLLILVVVLIINTAFSNIFWLSLIKLIKIFEVVIFGYYISNRTDLFNNQNIFKILTSSLVFFSLIGFLQFFRGSTSGNLFYLIGERNFSIYTPGIALVNWFGSNYLRIYSTFPHPNSFAGYLGVSLIFIILNIPRRKNYYYILSIIMLVISLFFTFSVSAYIAILLSLFLYFILKKYPQKYKWLSLFLILLFLTSFCLAIFSKAILIKTPSLSQSFSERLELADVSGKMFSNNWLFGTGLNTFISQSIYSVEKGGGWLLQPVHNIYLLILVEMGIPGVIALFVLFLKLLLKIAKTKKIWGVLIIVFVLVSGLFDHYWFTIQQNTLLLAFFIGFLLQKKRKVPLGKIYGS